MSLEESYDPDRVVLHVEGIIPKNPVPPENNTYFTLPAIDLTLTASGEVGSLIQTRTAGHNRDTAGYVFQASSIAMADVWCWPAGEVPAPYMSTTTIIDESSTIPTITSLSASPAGGSVVGEEVTLDASVIPAEVPGSVEFFDGETSLGVVEVGDGTASIVLDDLSLGEHSFVAEFTPDDPESYSPSASEPLAYTVSPDIVETTTQLAASPPGQSDVGDPVTLTATVSPADATGTVELFDGETSLGTVEVNEGTAALVLEDLSVGEHSFTAIFTPDDPEAFTGSESEPVAYEVVEVSGEPVFACQGTDDVSIGLMKQLVAPPDGILYLETPLIATVPETLANGSTGDVSFTWTVTLPENLANLAIAAEAEEIFMEDMTLAMIASGGSEQVWEFPATHTITDPAAPITLETSGSVTPSATEDIVYSMRSPVLITIHVPPTPIVDAHVYVNLSCEVQNAEQAITTVIGEPTAPGAPTGVTATAGPLMAHVSWTPPANDGGSPITGYVITTSPGGKTTHTSAEVTSVDVIGLEEGEDYTFTVQAVNEVGPGEASEPTDEVTPSAGHDFSDVNPDHPFYEEIEWLAATGITTGFNDDTFRATATLTRQAMAAFLYRMAGSPDGPTPSCTTMPFTDVSLDNDFCGEITWLKDTGITNGMGDGSFNPTGGLSRQAMAAFLYRFAGEPNGPEPTCSTPPFTDVPTSNPFCGEIAWMAEVGISEGFEDGSFHPNDTLTRQAMAAFLYRYTTVIPTEL